MKTHKFWIRVLLRRLPIFLCVSVALCALSLVAVQLMPRKFEARTNILMASPKILESGETQRSLASGPAQLETIRYRLMTRDTLAGLITKLDLQAGPDTTLDQQINSIRRSTRFKTVSGRDKPTVLTVSFKHRDPVLAAEIVNALADRILHEHKAIQTEQADQKLAFYHDQVQSARVDLLASEQALENFQVTHADALPANLSHYLNRISKIQDYMLFRTTYRNQQSSDRNLPTEISRLETELDAASALFAPQHPMIKLLTTQLSHAQNSQSLGLKTSAASSDLTNDRQLKEELETLQAATSRIPQNASKLSVLQRDQSMAEQRFQATIDNFSKAATSERIATLEKGVQLSIIESAIIPKFPDGPAPRMLMALGVIASILLTALMSILLERHDRTLRRPRDLAKSLGISAFAVIPDLRPAS